MVGNQMLLFGFSSVSELRSFPTLATRLHRFRHRVHRDRKAVIFCLFEFRLNCKQDVIFCFVSSVPLCCFDPRFKENIHCHSAFIIGDIIIRRESYSKGALKSRVRKSHHSCKSYNTQFFHEQWRKESIYCRKKKQTCWAVFTSL